MSFSHVHAPISSMERAEHNRYPSAGARCSCGKRVYWSIFHNAWVLRADA